MLADVCRGRAGVRMSEWCVHEVREMYAAFVVTSQGRPRQRREQAWERRGCAASESRVASSATSNIVFGMSSRQLPWGAAPRP
jgi:hypothetical protein